MKIQKLFGTLTLCLYSTFLFSQTKFNYGGHISTIYGINYEKLRYGVGVFQEFQSLHSDLLNLRANFTFPITTQHKVENLRPVNNGIPSRQNMLNFERSTWFIDITITSKRHYNKSSSKKLYTGWGGGIIFAHYNGKYEISPSTIGENMFPEGKKNHFDLCYTYYIGMEYFMPKDRRIYLELESKCLASIAMDRFLDPTSHLQDPFINHLALLQFSFNIGYSLGKK